MVQPLLLPRGAALRPEEVALRTYEIMLILPSEADDAVVEGVTNRVGSALAPGGGQVTKTERWGRRRLAYEIGRQSEGFYLVVECSADPEQIKELDRVLALSDDVIRFKVVVRPAA
jgi:small subunit ribosomal protein S6